jgi:hypothetical protein
MSGKLLTAENVQRGTPSAKDGLCIQQIKKTTDVIETWTTVAGMCRSCASRWFDMNSRPQSWARSFESRMGVGTRVPTSLREGDKGRKTGSEEEEHQKRRRCHGSTSQ